MTDKLNHNPQPELSEPDAELLSAYMDEMLSLNEQRELEARLLQDAFLRNELRAMRQTVSWMNALPTLKAPRNFTISAQDVAPLEKPSGRKVIPMQNRNLWYMASAAALVVVLVGFLAVLPLTSNQKIPAGGDSAAESIAFSATESLSSTTEVLAQTLDTADTDTSSDIALFQADGVAIDSFAEESAEMDDAPAEELDNTANIQSAMVVNTVSATDVAFAVAQETSTALADSSARASSPQAEQASNFAFPTATTFAIGQGGGNANNSGGADSPPASADMMAETTVASDDSDPNTITTGTIENLEAEAPVAPQDESQASDVSADSGASGASVNSADTVGESRSSEPEPSNLIQAVLQAMRQYVESQQP